MSNDKVKVYKNPARSNEPVVRQPYIPQYQVLGLEPDEHERKTLPANVLIAQGGSSDDNPRTRRPSIRLPYAEAADTSQLGNDPIPNVGNNMEQTWSSIDGEIIDDITGEVVPLSDSNELIDNNDYVSVEKLSDKEESVPDEQKPFMTVGDLIEVVDEDVDNDLLKIPDDQYILILKGKIFHIGSMKEVEELTSALVFGELPLPDGKPIPIEDIIVLKKIKLKVGLFLE